MQHRKIAFIGAGNMTKSIIGGLIKNGYPADLIIASNPSVAKLNALKDECGINITQDNNQAIEFAQAVVLAVKPQLMEQVSAAIDSTIDLSDKLFISIAAGITTTRLKEMLGGNYSVIRTMPNTPSALALGMTGLFADANITAEDKEFAGNLLSQVGKIAWVEEEPMMDGVIAAAGSSPAYFFLFLEAMEKEAMAMGFTKSTARLLVQQAMLGAAEMVCHNPNLELSELRTQVTSKGGTTAKAVEALQQQGLEKIIAKAMQAAVQRAEEMSRQF
ncbi:pyrroline-5-carboxylate reductase [Paraglaciecola sp. 2405UD69-4]|uniref:pyrroline-5-carboxylate reductase n=1 Tax=Paraglaciecola sp. 2405UD69-4 TaxID=3391836 RepID=UPI0039C996E9